MSVSTRVPDVQSRTARQRTSLAIVAVLLIAAALVGIGRKVWPERITPRSYACDSNLEQILLAMQVYHASHGSLPPAYLPDEEGRPMHSWRVLLLPYLPAWDGNPKELYEAYDFSEAWDGPNNRRLAAQMPRVYRCPEANGRNDGSTSYVVVTGRETAFSRHRSVALSQIGDGLDATVLVAEAGRVGIPWMEPRDVPLQEAVPADDSTPSLAANAIHPEGFWLGFADGEVCFVPRETGREKLRAGFTINGGEPLSEPTLAFAGTKPDGHFKFKVTNPGIRTCYFYGSMLRPQRLTQKGWAFLDRRRYCGNCGVTIFRMEPGDVYESLLNNDSKDTRPFRAVALYATSRSNAESGKEHFVSSAPVQRGTTEFVSKQGVSANLAP